VIVVSDTGPLNYAILIECVELLPALYGKVYIPRKVAQELRDIRSHDAVLAWMASPPAWLIETAPAHVEALAELDAGEVEAIALARELGAELLIDDLKARGVASRLGLKTVGLLGMLRGASHRNLVDLIGALDRLERTSFFVSRELLADMRREELLRRDRRA
jgi:hypothetical protein